MKYIAVLVTLGLLSGCATPYQKFGFTGGYKESRLDKNTLSISYEGNGYTDNETVQRYMFYRCAEATVENGFDYFVLIGSDSNQNNTAVTTPGHYVGNTTASAYSSGNYARGNATTTGTYYPGVAIPITWYNGTALIKMFNGTKPENISGAFDAHDVLTYMTPSVRPEAIKAKESPASMEVRPAAVVKVKETTQADDTSSMDGQLRKLKQLKDEGIFTEDEYQQEKKKILNRQSSDWVN